MQDISIYIHIPFCDHKCIYCDFYSIITEENTGGFLSSITKEIESQIENLQSSNIISIFFGGGTPSLLQPEQIKTILNFLESKSNFDPHIEITLETNPGTVDFKKLTKFKEIGINRISIGVQSFNENDLKFLTRIHDKQTALDTICFARDVGFQNINIDLIFSLPKQSRDTWKENLEIALTLPIQHISAYSLILEGGTILNKMVLDGKIKLKDEDYDASQYEYTINFLTKSGFDQYEVSNFCKPGFECVHNLSYWGHKQYLGFGPSAHSFFEGRRWWNYSSLKMYMDFIDKTGNAIRGHEELSQTQLQQEFIMLAMRSKGLELKTLIKQYGDEWISANIKYIDELKESGYIIENDNFIKFTNAGYLLCDEIIQKFK